MDTVKTYHNIDPTNAQARFSISSMEEVSKKRNAALDEPHRHDYYTVLVVCKAKGTHKIDFNAYALGDQQIYFVAPGQVHHVVEEQASIGYVLTFSTEFLVTNAIQLSFIDQLNLFHAYGQSPPLQPTEQEFEKMKTLCAEMFYLFNSSLNMKELSIGAYLKLLLIACNNICSTHTAMTHSDIPENRILRAFKQQVNQDYKTEHSTSYYAQCLHITPDHLNRIIKATIGKTAKEYIQSRITTEAKRLLYFSNLSNKEIGDALGFSEPANFSAFFKKCTGYSPSNFLQKEQMNKP